MGRPDNEPVFPRIPLTSIPNHSPAFVRCASFEEPGSQKKEIGNLAAKKWNTHLCICYTTTYGDRLKVDSFVLSARLSADTEVLLERSPNLRAETPPMYSRAFLHVPFAAAYA